MTRLLFPSSLTYGYSVWLPSATPFNMVHTISTALSHNDAAMRFGKSSLPLLCGVSSLVPCSAC